MMRLILIVALLCAMPALLCAMPASLCATLSAQETHDHPAPEKLGMVSFRISCQARTQAEFDRAVALLHSFAYSAAEAAFRSVAEKDRPRRTKARAIAALCVGGMVAARSLADRALADELRDACMATALKLGNWDTRSAKPKSR